MSTAETLARIQATVGKTMCPTYASDAGDIGVTGQISATDFETLVLLASGKAPAEIIEKPAPPKPEERIRDFLTGVVGVVEATNAEKQALWERYTGKYGVDWKSRLDGLGETIGYLAEMPVFISLQTAEVGGFKLLFFHATSQVVDHRLIEEWLRANVPGTAWKDGRVNKTDADNFINVFPTNPIRTRSDATQPPGFVKPDNEKQVFFYEQDFYVLSNFSAFNHMADFCRRNLLDKKAMSLLATGNRKRHKGWTLVENHGRVNS